MDDSELTSRAIAELMHGMSGQDSRGSSQPQERKMNPLGKPNKRFLGRTIHNALQHNKQRLEQTQAHSQQKLKELDDRYEQRKKNAFYNRYIKDESLRKDRRHKSRSIMTGESRYSSRDGTRCNKNLQKKHSRRNSRSRSASRSRGHQTKLKKKRKSEHKSKKLRKRTNSTSDEEASLKRRLCTDATEKMRCQTYSNKLALAVAMAAYSQELNAHQTEINEVVPPISPSSDINRELISDEDTPIQNVLSDALSTDSSRNDVLEMITINVSSQDEQSDSTSSLTDSERFTSNCIGKRNGYKTNAVVSNSNSDEEADSAITLLDSESDANSCIVICDSISKDGTPSDCNSDIEVIEYNPLQLNNRK